MSEPVPEPSWTDPARWRLLPFGLLLLLFAAGLACLASILSVFGALSLPGRLLYPAGIAFLVAVALIAADIGLLLPRKRQRRLVAFDAPLTRTITVVLTALNDEQSIADAVRDFQAHPLVRRVVVIENASTDRTRQLAAAAGAEVITEPLRGYGHCVHRALAAGASFADTELTLLCEGDMTFRAFDIDKFLAYIPHALIVNGTRIVEQLRDRDTQLTTFVYYGNFAVGKLLEAKYIGQGTFTDVGTTYKLCRNSALRSLLPHLNRAIGMEFNAHFLDQALRYRIPIVECPVTFHNRLGRSKGGNASNFRALLVGLSMTRGILFGWPRQRRPKA